jgi:magnesium transporter
MLQAYPAAGSTLASRESTPPVWIDALAPTAEESAELASQYGVEIPSRAQLEEIESSSRLRTEGEVLYLSMPVPDEGSADVHEPPIFGFRERAPFGFILNPDILITVRFAELHVLPDLRKRLAALSEPPGGAAVFVMLVESMVDYAADVLERLAGQLGTVSRQVFVRRSRRAPRLAAVLRDTLCVVGDAGEQLARVRESVLALARIIAYVADSSPWLRPEWRKRLKTARSDLDSLVDFEGHLAGQTQFLLDAILGFINTEQNDMFKVLTIASVVGIPPTLIASMYGMNFHYMPELSWRYGYAYGLALIAASTLIPIIWFKRRGWW